MDPKRKSSLHRKIQIKLISERYNLTKMPKLLANPVSHQRLASLSKNLDILNKEIDADMFTVEEPANNRFESQRMMKGVLSAYDYHIDSLFPEECPIGRPSNFYKRHGILLLSFEAQVLQLPLNLSVLPYKKVRAIVQFSKEAPSDTQFDKILEGNYFLIQPPMFDQMTLKTKLELKVAIDHIRGMKRKATQLENDYSQITNRSDNLASNGNPAQIFLMKNSEGIDTNISKYYLPSPSNSILPRKIPPLPNGRMLRTENVSPLMPRGGIFFGDSRGTLHASQNASNLSGLGESKPNLMHKHHATGEKSLFASHRDLRPQQSLVAQSLRHLTEGENSALDKLLENFPDGRIIITVKLLFEGESISVVPHWSNPFKRGAFHVKNMPQDDLNYQKFLKE